MLLQIWLTETAAGENKFAGKPLSVIRSEEHGDRSDIIRLTQPAERCLGDGRRFPIRAKHARSLCSFGYDHPGINRVDANLLRSKLLRQHPGDRIDSALGPGIDGRSRRSDAAHDRSDIDNAAA